MSCHFFSLSLVAAMLLVAALPSQVPGQEPDDVAQDQPQTQVAEQAADRTDEAESPEVAAVRKQIESLTQAFNKHDAAAVAAHWTEQGEFITPAGEVLQGREAILEAYQKYFENNKEAKLDVGVPAVELHSPSVASERGVARVVSPEGEPSETEYVAVHLKTPEGWKIDSIREDTLIDPVSNYDKLHVLDGLIGAWASSDEDVMVTADYRWTKNGNFIVNQFKVFQEDVVSLEGTQIIGWDAGNSAIRSWVFDSEGGFGVGRWEPHGDGWKVRSLQVLADGSRASSTQLMEPVDDDTLRFRTVGREVGGELLPNVGPVEVVRQ